MRQNWSSSFAELTKAGLEIVLLVATAVWQGCQNPLHERFFVGVHICNSNPTHILCENKLYFLTSSTSASQNDQVILF